MGFTATPYYDDSTLVLLKKKLISLVCRPSRSVPMRISDISVDYHDSFITWKSIRLELARTEEFPEGSASRAYLLRLPLDQNDLIDEQALGSAPAMATVQRHWPNQPDVSGYVIRTSIGWALAYESGDSHSGNVFHLDPHPIRIGEQITVTEPDGRKLPFRVSSLKQLN